MAALGPALVLAAVAYERRWISDDGLINVRVVEQLLGGNGPNLNAGERVEVATSPLWVLAMAVGTFLWRTEVEYAALALGIVLTAGGVMAAAAAAAISGRTARPHLWLPAGMAAYAALPPAWDFATSGLDTGLAVAWIGTATLLLALTEYQGLRSQALGAAFVIGLGPLVRPDLVVMAAVFLVGVVGLCRKRAVPLLAMAGAAPVLYQLFRMGYYGVVVPNTAIAKEASEFNVAQGLEYVGDLYGNYAFAVPTAAALVLTAVVALRRAGALAPIVVPTIAGLLHGAYIVLVGGDFMSGRLLLPSVFAMLTPVAMVAVRLPKAGPGRRGRARRAPRASQALALGWFAVPALVLAGWAYACAANLRNPYGHTITEAGLVDERAFWLTVAQRDDAVLRAHYGRYPFANWARITAERAAAGDRRICPFAAITVDRCVEPPILLDGRWPARAAAIAGNIGIISATAPLDVHIVDAGGLGEPLVARQAVHERGRPGHEKLGHPAWVMAKFAAPGSSLPGDVDAAAVESAREVLRRCERFVDLERATTERLTPGRILNNIVGAFGRSFWRFDPAAPPRC